MKLRRSVFAVLASSALAASALGTSGTFAQAASQPPLVIQVNGTIQENFNPLSVSALPGTDGMIYEPLFYFNTMGKPAQYGLLGTSFSWSKKAKVLTVHLRKNVKWSDGQPFTANDVLFTFNVKKQFLATDGFGFWNVVSSVTAPNPNTVVFTFKRADVPYAPYILQDTVILPQHIWSKIQGDPTKDVNANPVGTGPYTLKSFSQTAYLMQANPKYWGGKPAVDTIEYPSYNGGDSVAMALAAGQIDWGGGFIANIDKVYVSKDPAHRGYWFPPAAPILLYTNNNDPILGQVPVRQAISEALNRTEYANVAEYGYEKIASPSGLLLPNFNSWLNKKLPQDDVTFPYNSQAAENILIKAGFKKGSDGYYQTQKGKDLEFTLNVVAGWPDWDEMAGMIQQDLKKIGIKVDVQQLQVGAWAADLRGHKFQMAIGGGAGGPTPYYFFNNLMSPNSGMNYEQWYDGKTKLLLDKFAYATSPKVQRSIIGQLEQIMATQLPSIPLVDGATWFQYNSTRFTGWPSNSNPYADPAPYDWPSNEVVITHIKPAH